MANLARQPRNREVPFHKCMHSHFAPGVVRNPETDMPFSESSAWEFMANLLESDHPFTEMTLDEPRGLTALTTLVEIGEGLQKQKVYIKIHPFKGKVCCRSFHLDLGVENVG
jgi:hypothetical protein